MGCKNSSGRFRWLYTGNQVGFLNETGFYNFVAGGPAGSGISAGTLIKKFFQTEYSRAVWQSLDSTLSQKLLDAAWPFIELQWIAEIKLSQDIIFKVSNRNVYVKDEEGKPRFYEARAQKAPSINITSGEWLSPNFEIGDLKITLNNRDGFFNDYLPQGIKYTQWIGAEIKVFVGFEEERSNYFEVFCGYVPHKKGVETTLEEIVISAYNKMENDDVELPTLIYDTTNYPFVDTDKIGKVLPIVYGDYSLESTSEYGDIPAICSNANDENVIAYVWNISENALREIGNVYLHRGDRVEDRNGPIKILDNVLIKDPDRGRILIPTGIPALEEFYILIDNGKPGEIGEIGEIIIESSEKDFKKIGVQVGDIIYKEGDTNPYEIIEVAIGAIQTTIPTILTKDDSYKILTNKYMFKKGDKISCFCKGKDIEIMSTTRITDTGLTNINPILLSIGLFNDYWTVDNDVKKIYNMSFDDKIIKQYDFSDISSEITQITGLNIQTDNTLWIFDRPLSTIYRFIVEENALRLSFSTLQISGLETLLEKGGPISIDDGNIITIHEQISGNFYRINPFGGAQPGLIGTFNRDVFEPNALDIVDIASDVNTDQLIVMDRNTEKVYRIDKDTGTLVSEINLITDVSSNFTQARGIGYYIDGTIFLLNKQDLSIYNYNEFENANDNPGFIVRDILQSYAGKSTFDFDLRWNQTCRGTLSTLKARVSIDSQTKLLSFINSFMQCFNCSIYLNFQKYSLFHITFSNFITNGLTLREGDIKHDTFNPTKEFEQYFNSAYAFYKERPFSGNRIASDNYVSPTGIQLASKEIKKELNLSHVYRREDLDVLMPLFVRLAAAEPEFVDVSVGFRFLFAQLNSFYNINFKDIFNLTEKSGRRFDNVPSFVRKISLDLDLMQINLRLWSLGTTQFGNWKPVGIIAGGQNDQIILTNLGTVGYVSPIGDIVSSTLNSISVEDVEGQNAENRVANVVGKAWGSGYIVGLYSGTDHALIEELEIDIVLDQEIKFKTNIFSTVENTTRNGASFIVGGHYLKYIGFNKSKQEQSKVFCYFGHPLEGYPINTTKEIEEQRAGKHNFSNNRLPYVLYPKNYLPT